MAAKSSIRWTDATWNPWRGCEKVSPGCANCYMFRDQLFYGKDPSVVVRTTTFNDPLKWLRNHKLEPGSKVFTCSWSDWFIDKADAWRDEAWAIVKATPYRYLILTKRPERIVEHLPKDWGAGYPNVWLGVSAENQVTANHRIPVLLSIPAQVRFVSAEPLLGPINFTNLQRTDKEYKSLRGTPENAVNGVDWMDGVDWIITGGESDRKAPRPMDPNWAREIREQCRKGRIAFFHKQNGGKTKDPETKEWGGRLLDGIEFSEFPNDRVAYGTLGA